MLIHTAIYGQNICEEPIKETGDMSIIPNRDQLLDSLISNEECPQPNRNYTNVNCNQIWQNEKNAVVRIEIPLSGGGYDYCSGALINTTAGESNNRHFILTANHCLTNSIGPFPDISQWRFHWHYESSECNSTTIPPQIYTIGAKVVARSSYADFALLELFEDPAEAWDVTPYYLGWDSLFNGVNTNCEITIIHHPNGMVKKIFTNKDIMDNRHNAFTMYCTGAYRYLYNNNFWKTNWYPEELPHFGSSGAPLLNKDKRIIGQHFGTSCDYIYPSGYAYYILFGKFSHAWEGYNGGTYNCISDSTNRLKDWLDPLNTGQLTLDGRSVCQQTIKLWRSLPRSDYHAVQNIISKQKIADGTDVTYRAGSEIVLMFEKDPVSQEEVGFHVEEGATFRAYIEELDCNPTTSSSPFYKEEKEEEDFLLSQLKIPNEINLIPNPNNGAFQLETNFSLSEISNLKISNLLGLTVYETQNLTSNTIQLQNVPAGLFFVVMILKDGSVLTQKMMIQR